jgi:sugar phosphate permease
VSDDPGPRRKPRFFYGWVIVAVVAAGGFTQSAETFNVLSVLLKPMNEEFGWSRTTFAGAMALGSLFGGVVALFLGPLMDRFGPRLALTIAFAILGAVFLLTALITTLWQFYALQVVARMMTSGVMGVATAIIIPKWFIEKRGRAVALGSIGGQAGSAITPLYVQILVSISGWRVAVVVAGIAIWVVSLPPTALFMRRQPEDIGLLPDGAQPHDDETSDGKPAAPRNDLREPEASLPLSVVRRLPSFYLLTAAISMTWLIRTGVTLHFIPYFTDHGFSPEIAVLVLMTYSTTGVAGALIWGVSADRFGARLSFVADCLLIGVGLLLLLVAATSMLAAFAWAAFWGVTLTGSITLQRVIFADYYGRRHLGSIQGPVTLVQTIAQAIGPIAGGLAYDASGSYVPAFSAFAIAGFAASVFVFLARPPARG